VCSFSRQSIQTPLARLADQQTQKFARKTGSFQVQARPNCAIAPLNARGRSIPPEKFRYDWDGTDRYPQKPANRRKQAHRLSG
jgi:hypothetical protein